MNLLNDEYQVEIDNCHSTLNHEGTDGTITVEFWASGKIDYGKVASKSKKGPSDCTKDNKFTIYTTFPITHIIIRTNSGNAFFLDEIYLYKNGNRVARYGSDDGLGWCLSTDANDKDGSWKGNIEGGICTYFLKFNYPTADKGDQYEVEIDNCHSTLTAEGTGGTILVEFFAGKERVAGRSKSKPGECTKINKFNLQSTKNISHIVITTNSEDAFFLDEIYLRKNGKTIIQYGKDDGKGWCLSTDPEDKDGSWKDNIEENSCRSSWSFEYSAEQKGDEYQVEIDNCHSTLTAEGTGGTITVEFWSGNKRVGSKTKKGLQDCTKDNKFTIRSKSKISHIVIKTNSEDAFFLDEIYLRKNGDLEARYGIDDFTGWCLSTDPADKDGSWKNNIEENNCTPFRKFEYPSSNNGDEYQVEIDNCHSFLSDEGTDGTITVEFFSGNEKVDAVSKQRIPECTTDNKFTIRSTKNITQVIIKSNSGDALLLDEIYLRKNGQLKAQYGTDDGAGWCLSTEAQDNEGAWKDLLESDLCRTNWEFKYDGTYPVVDESFRVVINGLVCLQTADVGNATDEPYFEVFVDDNPTPFVMGPQEINETDKSDWEKWKASSDEFWIYPGSFYAKNKVIIKLWEKDSGGKDKGNDIDEFTDNDDFIGEIEINRSTQNSAFILEEFRKEGEGKWDLAYSKQRYQKVAPELEGTYQNVKVRVPILNQGNEGACVAFAVVGALTTTFLNQIQPGSSKEELFDAKALYDRRGYESQGWQIKSALDTILSGGIPFKNGPHKELILKSYYKYYKNGKIEKVTLKNGNIHTEETSESQIDNNGYNKMRKALKSGKPLLCSYDVYPDFQAFAGTDGVYAGQVTNTESDPTGHAVFVTGYRTSSLGSKNSGSENAPIWYLQNSWGRSWGDHNGVCKFVEGTCDFDDEMYQIGEIEVID